MLLLTPKLSLCRLRDSRRERDRRSPDPYHCYHHVGLYQMEVLRPLHPVSLDMLGAQARSATHFRRLLQGHRSLRVFLDGFRSLGSNAVEN